ncbi:transporter substrate-binding domain-containing protein [Chitinivorax sp. B]|uniref:substrate-binding periplasmic protein n=1 Tax=Chitinivorax sp. B TaxID=2502235 RepID=UPI0010F9C975|nr:transporter substrate-binding domain-containing protein [Chitinivorax sp. B]
MGLSRSSTSWFPSAPGLIIALLAVWPGVASWAGHAPPLVLCFEDVPQKPWTFPDGTGLNFDLLKAVEKQLNEQFVFQAKPWKRCLQELRAGMVDGVIGGQDVPERRQYAVFPTQPSGESDSKYRLYWDHYFVFVRQDSKVTWDGNELRHLSKPVAIQSGYAIRHRLKQMEITFSEPGKSATDGLRMLEAGAVDAAILLGQESTYVLRHDPRFKARLTQLAPAFETLPFFLFFAKTTYTRSPQRLEAIWRGIADVRESAAYKQREAEQLAD